MKTHVSLSSAVIAGEFVALMFNVRTMVHVMHLNTRSNSQHMALDEYYKQIVDLTDRFAEAAFGQFKTIVWPESFTEGLVSSSELEPISYLNRVKAAIEKMDDLIDSDDLETILAEMLELTTRTLYKLEQLA